MPALWRLTRTETAHRVYDALKAHGLTATQMDEYVVHTSELEATRDPPTGVEVRALDSDDARVHEQTYDAFAELRDDERAVCAFDTDTVDSDSFGGDSLGDDSVDGDSLVGYLFLGDPGLTYRIHPLETDVTFSGGYIRRVFVAPSARNRGIATTLVSEAVSLADEQGAETVHALVARDNRPSQWTFESNDFRVERTRSYYRIGPWRRQRVTER
ncbi:GNAT family N-acetyltransferase [Haloferax mediterranei ATCC 33500]|uniref:GNAT family N-acetyltransferase n=1 Tax=Haloferax mediterranei (strain ATCC 33500 / DSM 1411 / JCM 8866 / NBRC 14739 / NCIMB 2177 / R-4) TaxID=523841 RepID=I3R697_HALMT|nr:GNAT family N-acetyltransferase [Haloferax mediterranei]AFK19757.1 protein N-acetyltransferase-like protein [Haloferax mediterranei ATCC 33500]AHZ23143.1 GNAT family acetyltransferase [Haloferax mediterranei ATCC 33500]EMA00079.1 protein N-acetyltransferase-like protein [Haloferax mediterranei ATCC 33500]MDX5987498.1 GNAT family N-acetyltransferase [Haloferax mediterranei ATCC 33500]QCQ73998.1 GNAT family N-acetyltransferase [Haloferax mediterranei ATCC 33500]